MAQPLPLTVRQTAKARELDLELRQEIGIPAADAVAAMPGIGRITEIAKMVLEGKRSLNIPAQMSDGSIPRLRGINTFG
jgi:hypothetical protein